MAAPLAAGLLLAWLAQSSPAPPAALTIEHDGVGCIVAERSPRLLARVLPRERLARARVFFHARGAARWYSVDMRQAEDRLEGVLPRPLKTTPGIDYYIEAVDTSSSPTRTAEYAPRVVPDPGACDERRLVAALLPGAERVAVRSAEGKPSAPEGFDEDSVAAVAAGGGLPAAVWLAGGGAAVAGIAVAAAGGGSDGGSPSGSLRLDGDWFPTLTAGGVITGQGATLLQVSGTTITACTMRVPFSGCPVQANNLLCSNAAAPGSISSTNVPVSIQGNSFTLTVSTTYNGGAPAIVDQLQVTMTGTFASSNSASGTFTGSWVRTGVTPFNCPTAGTWTATR